MTRLKAAMILLMLSMPLALGCKSKSDEANAEHSSGAEQAGEAIDEAAEDTGNAVDEAADDTGDAVEEAGDEADKKL